MRKATSEVYVAVIKALIQLMDQESSVKVQRFGIEILHIKTESKHSEQSKIPQFTESGKQSGKVARKTTMFEESLYNTRKLTEENILISMI